jgi:hypothetical protein
MSVGKNLQEMENVVTKGAAPAEPMPQLRGNLPPGQNGYWEDLGGPTPENYRPDDDSAKISDPAANLSQVRDVVTRNAVKEEVESEEEDTKKAKKSKKSHDEDEDDKDDVKCEEAGDDDEYDDDESSDEDEDEDEDETVEYEEESYNIEDDVNALLEGEGLSEEFEQKARTIFEAAIRSKAVEIKEQLQEHYESALVEEVQNIKNQLTEEVDAYLEYVSDVWIQENALAVEKGIKSEITESFLSGMRDLFESHYVSIPEDKYDVLESMVDKLDEMEAELNEQIEQNIALNQRLAESVADVIFSDVSEGLALSQKEKFATLAENVEFDSEEKYREKLETLKESYFPTVSNSHRDSTENLMEDTNYKEPTAEVGPSMQKYVSILDRINLK